MNSFFAFLYIHIYSHIFTHIYIYYLYILLLFLLVLYYIELQWIVYTSNRFGNGGRSFYGFAEPCRLG